MTKKLSGPTDQLCCHCNLNCMDAKSNDCEQSEVRIHIEQNKLNQQNLPTKNTIKFSVPCTWWLMEALKYIRLLNIFYFTSFKPSATCMQIKGIWSRMCRSSLKQKSHRPCDAEMGLLSRWNTTLGKTNAYKDSICYISNFAKQFKLYESDKIQSYKSMRHSSDPYNLWQ